jgi:hypothetical protein
MYLLFVGNSNPVWLKFDGVYLVNSFWSGSVQKFRQPPDLFSRLKIRKLNANSRKYD